MSVFDLLRSSFRSGCRRVTPVVLGMLLLAGPGHAIPVNISGSNLPSCDVLATPGLANELGLVSGGFPEDSRIFTTPLGVSGATGCVSTDTGGDNVEVRIRNRTGRDQTALWYVGDSQTSLSNADGIVNGGLAFKIDSVGLNAPLLSESMTPDGIFEDDELWVFVIDDYANSLGLGPNLITSAGLVGDESDLVFSSGSIIAFIPEPSTALLLGLGLAGLGMRRRNRPSISR